MNHSVDIRQESCSTVVIGFPSRSRSAMDTTHVISEYKIPTVQINRPLTSNEKLFEARLTMSTACGSMSSNKCEAPDTVLYSSLFELGLSKRFS